MKILNATSVCVFFVFCLSFLWNCATKTVPRPAARAQVVDAKALLRVLVLPESVLQKGMKSDLGQTKLQALIESERHAVGAASLLVVATGPLLGNSAAPCRQSEGFPCFSLLKKWGVDVYVPAAKDLSVPSGVVLKNVALSGAVWLSSNTRFRSTVAQIPLQKEMLRGQWASSRNNSMEFKTKILGLSGKISLDGAQVAHRDFFLSAMNPFELAALSKDDSAPALYIATDDSLTAALDKSSSAALDKSSSASNVLQDAFCTKKQTMPRVVVSMDAQFLSSSQVSKIRSYGCLTVAQILRGSSDVLRVTVSSGRATAEVLPVFQGIDTTELSKGLTVREKRDPRALSQWLAESYRSVTKADVSIVKDSDVVAGLEAGALSFQELVQAIPGDRDLLGFDISRDQLEKGLCSAAKESFRSTGDLAFGGFRLEEAGTSKCRLEGVQRRFLKVVVDQTLLESSANWTGSDLRHAAFRYGLKTQRALRLHVDRNQGKL